MMTAFFFTLATAALLIVAGASIARMQRTLADMAQRILEQEVAQ